MCNTCKVRNPIHCIIPPHMSEKILEKTAPGGAKFARQVDNLYKDDRFRNRRNFFSSSTDESMKVLSIGQFRNSAAAIPKAVIEVYDAENTEALPGKLIRKTGNAPVTDKDVNNVYDAGMHTWNFYYDLFKRDSIDNKGMKMIQTVHYGKKYENAFWDGQQMVYGDGGDVFNSFTNDIDIIAHELSHGVVQYECNLDYAFQSGALNESLADVFGIMVKQKALNEDVAQSNWIIGENVMKGNYALRSLKKPGSAYRNHPEIGNDPQPGHMKDFQELPFYRDNGGVHINSGIPNHAFYLAATAIGGFAWEKTGRIWYEAMRNTTLLKPDATFNNFVEATIQAATKLFGTGTAEIKAVKASWKNVGL